MTTIVEKLHAEFDRIEREAADLRAQLAKVRTDRDRMIAVHDEMERERDSYRAMLSDVIASAHPNERDHPSMSKQWARARELLKNGSSPAAEEDTDR